MVTHSSTSRPVQCLCMAERTEYTVVTGPWTGLGASQQHSESRDVVAKPRFQENSVLYTVVTRPCLGTAWPNTEVTEWHVQRFDFHG